MLRKMLPEKCDGADDVVLYRLFADTDELADLLVTKTMVSAERECTLLLGRQFCNAMPDGFLHLIGG